MDERVAHYYCTLAPDDEDVATRHAEAAEAFEQRHQSTASGSVIREPLNKQRRISRAEIHMEVFHPDTGVAYVTPEDAVEIADAFVVPAPKAMPTRKRLRDGTMVWKVAY